MFFHTANLAYETPDACQCEPDPCEGYPLKVGQSRDADGDSGVRWAIFTRLSPFVAEVVSEAALDPEVDAAFELTGWVAYYGGPGRICQQVPCWKVYAHKVLVWQRWVRDV